MKATKSLVGLAVCAAWVFGAGSATAGEITGNGKWIAGSPDAPLNGKSLCAYSGQQDDPSEAAEEGFIGLITQNWGQLPKAVRDFLTNVVGVNPGINCNPTRTPGEPG
jgi:hypothetical protein